MAESLQLHQRGGSLAITKPGGDKALALGTTITVGVIGFLEGIETHVPFRASAGKIRSIELSLVGGVIVFTDQTDDSRRIFSTKAKTIPLMVAGQGVVSFSTCDSHVMGVPNGGTGPRPGPYRNGTFVREEPRSY